MKNIPYLCILMSCSPEKGRPRRTNHHDNKNIKKKYKR